MTNTEQTVARLSRTYSLTGLRKMYRWLEGSDSRNIVSAAIRFKIGRNMATATLVI